MNITWIAFFSAIGMAIGLYLGSPSIRSQMYGFDIHEHAENGHINYFVWHDGIIETVFSDKAEAINYVNSHK